MAYYPMQVTFLINIINIIGNYTLIFGHFGFPPLGSKARPSPRRSAAA